MKHTSGWENKTPEAGEYIQVDEYDAEIVFVDEENRRIDVEVFDGDESWNETLTY